MYIYNNTYVLLLVILKVYRTALCNMLLIKLSSLRFSATMLQWACSECWSLPWRYLAVARRVAVRITARLTASPKITVTLLVFAARCCRGCRSEECPPCSPWTSCASWWVTAATRTRTPLPLPPLPQRRNMVGLCDQRWLQVQVWQTYRKLVKHSCRYGNVKSICTCLTVVCCVTHVILMQMEWKQCCIVGAAVLLFLSTVKVDNSLNCVSVTFDISATMGRLTGSLCLALQVLLFVFSILRKVAWDYGRLALVTDADR